MGTVKLLDCTLRDGGYVNDWFFGDHAVYDITQKLLQANIDYIEMGFLREEEYKAGRTVFSSVDAIEQYMSEYKDGRSQFCAMCEALNPLPTDKIEKYDGNSVGVIRVIVWKRILKEGFEYCRKIVKQGYRLCVQPNRIEQYSKEEFRDMLRMFGSLSPMAIYLVDSFGLLNSRQILEYARIADDEMEKNVTLGYHGHNNMQQAFLTAVDIVNEGFERDILLDSSVYGMGRGAGNLCTELIAQYMNEYCGTNYDIGKIMEINDLYIQEIYEKEKWGYRPCYYLTARHKCNPMYGYFYGEKMNLRSSVIDKILSTLSENDKIIFSPEKARKYAKMQGELY
jgi:4-hydroxy 2-oxovalerate aldolase